VSDLIREHGLQRVNLLKVSRLDNTQTYSGLVLIIWGRIVGIYGCWAVHDVSVADVTSCLLQRSKWFAGWLQVDAERAELDVLRGIKQEDWHKICQLSLEVHDIVGDEDVSCGTSRVEMLVHMLNRQGFRHVVTEQSPRMRGTNLYMMYATR
jgi:hypothetical protein